MMSRMLPAVRREFRPMLGIAVPIVLAELGWTAMGVIDTLMVGPLGPEAIGGVGLGSILFFSVAIFGMGLLLGLDTLVSQAFGAGRLDQCHHWLYQGVYLSVFIAIPLTAIAYLGIESLSTWNLNPAVVPIARPYLYVVTLSLLPLLFYATFRRYLQAMSCVRPITVALLAANIINAFVNWVLIYGKLGFPALGATGAAWATVCSRIVMAGTLLAAIVLRERRERSGLRHVDRRVDWPALRRLVGLGLPASLQITLEVGVFAMAMALAGRLSAAALAAHQIALNYASTTYMVPLGVANSGAVRVGQAVGRRDAEGARIAGWTAILLGVGFMGCAALAFVVMPRVLIGFFTTDPAVLATGASLLLVAAVFQMFDGLQGVTTGVLRGLGDTRTPMVMNLIGHWLLGLPAGYVACFWWGWGVQGLWIGLSLGLVFVGIALLRTWRQRIAALRKAVPAG